MWWLPATLVIPVLFAPLLPLPFERDEGEYAYAAQVLLDGGLPYRDAFLQKPPGIVLVYAAVQAFGGRDPAAFHAAALLSYLVTAFALGWLAARLAGHATPAAAVLLFGAVLVSPFYQSQAANTEAFMVAPVSLAVVALVRLREVGRALWAVLAGIAFGLAIFVKQPAAFHGVFLGATVAALGRTLAERARWVALFLTAAVLPYGIALTCFAWAGALPEFMDAVLWHNLEYVGRSPEGRSVSWGITPADLALLVAAPLAVLALAIRRRWWPAWLTGGWLLTAWWGAAIGGHFRGHYFIQVLPAAALAVALGVATLRPRVAAVLTGVAVALYVVSAPWPFGRSVEQLLMNRYGVRSGRRFASAPLLAAELRDLRPGPALVLGSEPELLYYAGRRSVTRYVIVNPLFAGYPSSARRRAELAAELVRTPPRVVVLVDDPPPLGAALHDSVLAEVARSFRLRACTRPDIVAVFRDAANCAPGARTPDLALYERK